MLKLHSTKTTMPSIAIANPLALLVLSYSGVFVEGGAFQ